LGDAGDDFFPYSKLFLLFYFFVMEFGLSQKIVTLVTLGAAPIFQVQKVRARGGAGASVVIDEVFKKRAVF
jgi:hypothetical protein